MEIKKLLALILALGLLQADETANRKCCTPCKPPSLNCPPKMPCCNPCDSIFDHYDPIVFNGWNLSAEWLLWKVQQKASTFALSPHGNHQSAPPTLQADAIGKYRSAKFDWNSGVRLGLDYTFQRDAWNFLGEYTYYSTSGHENHYRPSDPTLYLEATNRGATLPSPQDGADKLQSSTDFSYQEIDLLISRRFLAGCQVLLKFYSGATGTFIHEKWEVNGLYNVNTPAVTTNTYSNWRFNGGGIRIGLDTDWHIGCGMGLYNKFSCAGLVGSYSNRRKTTFNPSNLVQNGHTLLNPVRETLEEETWVVPNTQIGFGLTWNHRFESVAMKLLAGFEFHSWYDLHQFHQDPPVPTFPNNDRIDTQNSSLVNLWGLNFGIDFSF